MEFTNEHEQRLLAALSGQIAALDEKVSAKLEALDIKVGVKFEALDVKVEALGVKVEALHDELENLRDFQIDQERQQHSFLLSAAFGGGRFLPREPHEVASGARFKPRRKRMYQGSIYS